MIDVYIVKQKKQRKYIDSYNTEEKNDWCVCYKQKIKNKKKRAKKVHRFLCALCKTKNKKENKNKTKIQSTNHLNSSSHLILILCIEYIHLSFPIKPPIHITPKSISEILFCLFILQYFFDRSSLVCVYVMLFHFVL